MFNKIKILLLFIILMGYMLSALAFTSEKKISLDFQDIKVRTVLQTVASFSGMNIVVSDAVSGNITLHLNNLPWSEVLDVILTMRGLSKRKIGNVLLIAPQAELMAVAQQALLQQPGTPVRQINIEARIVNVDRSFERELGVRLGVTENKPEAIAISDRLNFNLPTAVVNNEGVHAGLAIAKLGAGFLLDLELSALESEGKGQVISRPRLLTADQQPATIEAGEEIPYQEATASGATNVAFKKAVLRLQVTPQITPENKIILKLVVNQDKRSSKPTVLGVPAIDTRHIETQVIVDNGETVVLGGIYERSKNHSVKKIPVLSDLPIVGLLFTNKETLDQQTSLLIFVTPRIVNPSI